MKKLFSIHSLKFLLRRGDRSAFIGKQGQISLYHYDFTAQALSKLSRGFDCDINDVQAMYEQKLFSLKDIRDCFELDFGQKKIASRVKSAK